MVMAKMRLIHLIATWLFLLAPLRLHTDAGGLLVAEAAKDDDFAEFEEDDDSEEFDFGVSDDLDDDECEFSEPEV